MGGGWAHGVVRKRVLSWLPKERKFQSFQVPQNAHMIVAYPTVEFEKEMVSGDAY